MTYSVYARGTMQIILNGLCNTFMRRVNYVCTILYFLSDDCKKIYTLLNVMRR